MSQAQAARPPEEPAANVKPATDAPRESEPEPRQAELDELDLDEEQEIGQRTIRILSRVRRRIRQQPLTATSGAFLLGFAFGNGLPKIVARAGIAIGLRLVMQRMFDGAELFEEEA